jgi:uncharacterized Zn finger protein (UPF0148 family)
VVPTKSIRATKRELSDWSGIRNVKTIDSHLRYFGAIGLIISYWERGENEGALYEVRLPEETAGLIIGKGDSKLVAPPDPASPHLTPPDSTSGQTLGLPHRQNLGSPHSTNVPIDSTTSEDPKTSFKTSTENDDDELRKALAPLLEAERELTGKNADPTRWRELAELLTSELKIAAGRTTVSSVPAFLAEHLRRRLWKKEKRQIEAETTEQEIAQGVKLDASQCPDCFGAGMWYPEGYDKGVAKCQHKRLTEASEAK